MSMSECLGISDLRLPPAVAVHITKRATANNVGD